MHFVFLPANNGINAQATSDHCNLQTKGSTTFFFFVSREFRAYSTNVA